MAFDMSGMRKARFHAKAKLSTKIEADRLEHDAAAKFLAKVAKRKAHWAKVKGRGFGAIRFGRN
jgi:hypothetical protein